jgi:hypothetical protein
MNPVFGERVRAEGSRVGPDPPSGYLHHGMSELHRGDLKRAEADLSAANAKARPTPTR